MSLILSLETSGLAGSVALSRNGHVLEQRSLEQSGRRHAQTLISECAELLTSQHLSPPDLNAVATTRGPGSFTGLRVGVVAVKTLAYALRIPLILLDTFDIIAAQVPVEFRDIWIVDDAQRQELYVGQYVRQDTDSWRLSGERFITPMRDWLPSLSPDDVVLGPGTPRIPAEIVGPRVVRDATVTVPRAETVCRLAEQKLATGEIDDLWTAAPFYVRLSAAEEKATKPQASAREHH